MKAAAADNSKLYLLLLEPTLHVKVWGGRRLESQMGKILPDEQPFGESWELHDTSRVANGALAGRIIGEILADHGHELVGPRSDPAAGFPLLAKLIDAAQWLSIQVHPNDEQARRLEGDPRGKTEAWVVLATEPGAQLVIGVEPGTGREEMAAAIRENRLETLLVYADVEPGDVLFIPAGTIHALGAGVLVYEIQQSSDTTYRLYDWGRMGLDGKPRQLHIDNGVAVSNLESLPEIKQTGNIKEQVVEMVSGEYFRTVLYQLNEAVGTGVTGNTGLQRFHALTCIEGEAAVSAEDITVTMKTGQTVLVPACIGHYTVVGMARILCSSPA